MSFAPAAAQPTPTDHGAVVATYCVACHNAQLNTASIDLASTDISDPTSNPVVWGKVVRKLRARAMPPIGMPRPDDETYEQISTYLETTLDNAALADPNPGRPAIQRLNRAEYANVMRDLLAVDTALVDIDALLPTDDSN